MSTISVNKQVQEGQKPYLVLHPIGFPQLPQKLLLLGVVKETDKISMRKNHLRVIWFYTLGLGYFQS